MKRLLDRRRRLLKRLPPLEEVLRGSILRRTLRCGKPGCHCAEGDGHPAVYLSVTFPGGRTEQISLPPDLVPQAEAWVANYHTWWTVLEAVSAINRDLLRAARTRSRSRRRSRAP